MKIRRLGGWRLEHISDTTLLKAHSIAAVRISLLRHARFEIVTDVLARKIASEPQFYVHQCRMFGESPKPLSAERIDWLVRGVLNYISKELVDSGGNTVNKAMELTDWICLGGQAEPLNATK